jgi:sec-independent protein translocase protein TatA
MTALMQGYDLLIVLALVCLLFGASQLPKLARSLGSASHEFKRGAQEGASASAEEGAKDAAEEGTKEHAPANSVASKQVDHDGLVR